MVKVKFVKKKSPSWNKIFAEDELVSINGHIINDVLDYMYYAEGLELCLVLKRRGFKEIVHIKRQSEFDDIGLEFTTFLMDEKQRCQNNCVFCFIDQNPCGMRQTLYFKDDDARLSFLQGNYITLTNLTDYDAERIIKMKIPLNISVHTTNPNLRSKMMGNRFAGDKLGYLWRFLESGIHVNCQIVLCPNYNDGAELGRTLDDLLKYDSIDSVAVVPVGLTKYRENLTEIVSVSKECALSVIGILEEYQNKMLEKHGVRKIFAADEFFLLAQLPLPTADTGYYEDYPQFSNGVGMLADLREKALEKLKNVKTKSKYKKITVSIATGFAAYDMIKEIAAMFEEKLGIQVNVYKIKNNFYGETVTVSGLLTGGDVATQLNGKELGKVLYLPENMFNADGITLDGMTVSDIEMTLNVNIVIDKDGVKL